MEAIIFINNDTDKDLHKNINFDYRYINFNSSNLDDLLLIAKYKILNYPTTLIINNKNKVIIRVRGSVLKEQLQAIGASL